MRLFHYSKDVGPHSTVWGYWLIEWKWLFSIVLLCFEHGSREAYHSHAFNCVSWVLSGQLTEFNLNGPVRIYNPSIVPVIARRDTFHRMESTGRTWVISFRGPWADTWKEFFTHTGKFHTLTHGREVLSVS